MKLKNRCIEITSVDLICADGKQLPFRDRSIFVVLDIGFSTILAKQHQEKVI
jgi:hypothetical protein